MTTSSFCSYPRLVESAQEPSELPVDEDPQTSEAAYGVFDKPSTVRIPRLESLNVRKLGLGSALLEVVSWIGTAVASGVLGNAAWHGLKARAWRVARRTRRWHRHPLGEEVLAYFAVRSRCAEVGLPMPPSMPKAMGYVVDKAGGITVTLRYWDDLRAKVYIPPGDLNPVDVEVTLYSSG